MVRATMDGTSAAGAFYAAVQIIAPSGRVMGTAISSSIAAGASADVSWFPRVAGQVAASSGGLPIIGFTSFAPAGNLVTITSTDPDNPTTIISLPSVTLDGATQVQFQFYASAIDQDQRGFTGQGAVLLELYRDSTALGIVGDWNAGPGVYFITSLYVSGFDTPAAGSYVYSIRGWKQVSGGSGPGSTNVYGTGVQTPHATRAGFMVLLNAT